MKNLKYSIVILLYALLAMSNFVIAQSATVNSKEKEIAYTKVITQRANKIVDALEIKDSIQYQKVSNIIVSQYRTLNTYHESRDAGIKEIRSKYKEQPKELAAKLSAYEEKADKDLAKIHKKYIKALQQNLSAAQIEKVKDGMTYGVLPITLKGYYAMLPNLTSEQKKQIIEYLTEAREHAMDASSSEKKHAWFGKYKGKINNYLSGQGIDVRKAGQEWEKRIKEEKAIK